MNFKTIFKSFKNKDMLKRMLIVLGLLVVYRFMAHIPVPLGEPATFQEAIQNLISKSDFGSFINLISGGGLTAFSILLVGISPYITASIVVQLVTKAVPRLEELSQDGETGRRKISQWTRILTVPLAILQSAAYIIILYQQVISSNTALAYTPTAADWLLSVTAMVAGSIILMWLGELMTEQGIGNGISLIIFTSVTSQLPTMLTTLGTELFNTTEGSLSLFGWFNLPVNPVVFWIVLGFAIAILIVIYFLVKLNEAQRVITINYAKRVRGNSAYGGIKSILPLKLIAAGVVPVIFATAFLSLPALIGQFIQSVDPSNSFATTLMNLFTAPSASNYYQIYGETGITAQWFFYPAIYFLLVILFTYFYTGIIFNPKEIADNLQKQGAFIEGVRPGYQTADYLSKTVNRLNLFGAIALGFIAMLPFLTDYIFILLTGAPMGLSLSGTGLLIVVTVALENLRQLNSRALMVTYDEYK